MPPFDENYLERREEQIQEMHMLRANSWAALVTGVALTVIGLILMTSGYETLGTILFVISLLFEAGTVFMFASYFALRSTDRAIQEEYEFLARYGEKLKRNSTDQRVRLTDDGELVEEHELEEAIRHQSHGESR